MDWISRRAVLLGLVAMLSGLFAVPATARPINPAQVCHASASAAETYADLARAPQRWVCSGSDYDVSRESMFLRYALPANARPRPLSLVTRVTRFSAITIAVTDAAGRVRSIRYHPADARHLAAGPLMAFALPQTPAPPRTVVVRIDHPWVKAMASQARLDTAAEGSGWSISVVIGMAMICGMLIVPLLLGFCFFILLRCPFVLWHGVMVLLMLVQAMVSTGFIHVLMDLDVAVEIALINLCYAVSGASGLLLMVFYLKADTLGPRVRQLLGAGAPLVLAAGAFTALPFDVLRPWSALGLYAANLITIGLIAIALGSAWQRHSKHLPMLVLGWLPMLLIGCYRVGSHLLLPLRLTETILVFQLAIALQAFGTSLAIMIRFLDLRRERDLAAARAAELEGVAGRDALTGLWNRHSIEWRFNELFHLGYRTMAVVDLDHFKRINDLHGHSVGDQVLKAVAAALQEDSESCAIRMGGEEFLLLLRGTNAAQRAERCRRALSTRIATTVPGLGHLVTASMGLVEHDLSGKLDVEFAVLYSHCDRLLYEAKRLGRNRTMRERLTFFNPELQAKTA